VVREVKVIFENDYLTKAARVSAATIFKKNLCQICERAGADWVKTSTGYGFVKQPDGSYITRGRLNRISPDASSVSAKVQVKAAGGIRDLDGLIKVRDLGGSRCGATATAAMMDEYRRRESAERAGEDNTTIVPVPRQRRL